MMISLSKVETNTMTARKPEPILTSDNSRFTQLPVKYPRLLAAYKVHESMFWTSAEIDYSADYNDWLSLTNDERYFIEHVLAFFSGADGIVLENLISNFCQEVKVPEARNFYAFQGMIENVHGMTYALLIDAFVKDPERKEQLFHAIDRIPCVQRKANWALKWLDSSRPFEERVIAFVVVEGVFFSGSFCSIFWLKSRHKMARALGKSNELIARDEGMHTDFGILLYEHLNNKVTEDRAHAIFKEAVDIEEQFICESLPCMLIGMNSELMKEYIRYVADRLLVQLGFSKLYNCHNPFDFMRDICLEGKTNFFEERVSEYQHPGIAVPTSTDSWDVADDF